MRFVFISAIFMFQISTLVAQEVESIVTDRPNQTEASSAISAGYFQVESGMLFMYEQVSSLRKIRTTALPNTLFRVGVAKYFELRAVVPRA